MSYAQTAEDMLRMFGISEADLIAALNRRAHAQFAQAVRTQTLAAKAGSERIHFTTKDGMGLRCAMSVHPFFYHYWGQIYGYECWKDEEFVRDFLRDNPECRVTSRNANAFIQAGIDLSKSN